jgi:hypothetical protein
MPFHAEYMVGLKRQLKQLRRVRDRSMLSHADFRDCHNCDALNPYVSRCGYGCKQRTAGHGQVCVLTPAKS